MFVIYHSSNLFGKVTGVSIVSLLENNKDADNIHILYIEKGLETDTRKKIQDLVDSYGRTIEFTEMPNWSREMGLSLKSCKNGWLGFGYNRLFITELVPENTERVLYLDSDTIVEGSLSYLWELDFDEYYIAAVDDCLSGTYKELVEISDTATYCNAGVLLLNLKKWREEKILETFKEHVAKRKGFFVFNEQTILNSIFSDKILILPCEYNINTLVYTFEYDELMKLRKPDHYSYSYDEFYYARNNPIITHYTGCFYIKKRPWIKNSDHPHADKFNYYYQLTPWCNEELMEDTRKTSEKLLAFFVHVIPKPIMIRCISYVYTKIRVNSFKKKLSVERE